MYKLSCRLEPDLEGLNKLLSVRSWTVCSRERSDVLLCMCGRHIHEFVGLDKLYELSSGIESDREGVPELLVLQWWTIFSHVGSDSMRCLFDG